MISDRDMSVMIQEITMNVPREESTVIRSLEASEAWDILTDQIAAIKAAGYEVEIPFDLPTVDLVDPDLVIEPVE